MGEIRDYVCNCGYQKRVFTGAGINGCNLNAIMRFFPKEAEQFLKERQTGGVQSYLLGNAIVECTHCKKIDTVPCFSYKTASKTVTYMQEACLICGNQVNRIEEEENIRCPKCGLRMNYTEVGNWD